MDHDANQVIYWGMVECDYSDDEVDELDKDGYNSLKRLFFVGILNSSYDDKEKKRGFLRKNASWISLEVFLGVLLGCEGHR